ncbi:MAG: hypothetical protein DRJ96_09030 [Thermoprotei archaeon]|nr:MAG: hypothetical protein DRJ96_09030 [Thermoprotei archaeon]
MSGRVFDLIIEPYVRAEAVSRYEFEFSPKPEEIREGLEMVIVNRATERVREDFMVETVELPGFAKLGWWAGAPFKTPPVEGGVEVLVNGTATESGGRVFNLYVLDVENFERYGAGLAFEAYFKGTGSNSYTFNFTIPPEKCAETLYLVFERVGEPGAESPELEVFVDSEVAYEKPVDIVVQYRVKVSWEERSYIHVPKDPLLGLIVLGVVLLIAAAVLKHVFKCAA